MDSRRIAVRGIAFKDGKVLAVTHKDKNGKETDYWAIPGGGLDPGESLIKGLHREMIEETGIAPKIGKLLFMQQYAVDQREFLEFFFHLENPQDYQTIDLSVTSHGHIELSRCEFVDPKQEYVLPKFLAEIDIESYITSNHPPYIADYL